MYSVIQLHAWDHRLHKYEYFT